MQGKINLDRLIRTPTQIGERFTVKGFICSLISVVFIIMYKEIQEIEQKSRLKTQSSSRQSHKTSNADEKISVLYISACSHLSELVNSANLVSGGLQALINCQTYKSHHIFRQTLVPIAILCQTTDMFLKPPLPTFQNPLMRNEKAGSGESVSRRAPSVVSEATTTSYQGFYAIFSIQFELI